MKNKTEITIKGRHAYIDGYVLGGDGRPCAVVVYDEGEISLVYITQLGWALTKKQQSK